jgi:hypothetical protein
MTIPAALSHNQFGVAGVDCVMLVEAIIAGAAALHLGRRPIPVRSADVNIEHQSA